MLNHTLKRELQPAFAIALLSLVALATSARGDDPATEGQRAAEPYDRLIPELMRQWKIPGGAVAVARHGKLVLSRGYGWADVDEKQPAEAESLFRIASISKPITAATILRLVEQGRLRLDDNVLKVLRGVQPPALKSIDPRFHTITVRQLLQHTAGFDSHRSFDPMFRSYALAQELGVPPPIGPRDLVRVMLGRPLDFDPGTRYTYSNFGYCLLGRVIEQVAGKPYEEAVQELVLHPAGITRMRLGRSRLADRAPGEVRYYVGEGDRELVQSVFPDGKEKVPFPYGGFYLEAMDAHGGWLASATDLVRFATALDSSRRPAILKPETVRLIDAPPAPRVAEPDTLVYGLGWLVRPVGQSANWFHSGSLPGTTTLLVRTHHGMVWAAVFNSRPAGESGFPGQLDRTLWKAYEAMGE